MYQTAEQLISAGQHIQFPFDVALSNGQPSVTFTKPLRLLAGKRLTALAQWQGQHVVAKLFFAKNRWQHAAHSEINGINALHAINVLTPQILYEAQLSDAAMHIVLFEHLNGHDLSNLAFWDPLSETQRLTYLFQLMTILAKQHRAGLIQTDLHLGNFFIQDQHIYCLDNGTIKRHGLGKPLSYKKSIDQLTHILGVFSDNTRLVTAAYCHYLKTRKWPIKQYQQTDRLFRAINKQQIAAQKRFTKKIWRTCSLFICSKSLRHFAIWQRQYDSKALQTFLKNIAKYCQNTPCVSHQTDNLVTLFSVNIDEKTYSIHRYQCLYYLNRLLLRSAKRTWANANLLNTFNIPTLQPIAFVRQKQYGLRHTDYYIHADYYGENLADYIKRLQDKPDACKALFIKLAKLFKQFFHHRLTPGNVAITNIIIVKQQPLLLSLDKMQLHYNRWAFKRCWQRDIKRYLANWQTRPALQTAAQQALDTVFNTQQ